MPDLDVSPALESSMLSDPIVVQRRQNPTNIRGRAQIAIIATYNTFAVVTPAGANDLQRLPDIQIQANGIKVTTEFTLQGATDAAGNPQSPDWIVYDGNTYQVVDLQDMTQWGMSWTRAVCVMVDAQPSQQPAQTWQGATDQNL